MRCVGLMRSNETGRLTDKCERIDLQEGRCANKLRKKSFGGVFDNHQRLPSRMVRLFRRLGLLLSCPSGGRSARTLLDYNFRYFLCSRRSRSHTERCYNPKRPFQLSCWDSDGYEAAPQKNFYGWCTHDTHGQLQWKHLCNLSSRYLLPICYLQ